MHAWTETAIEDLRNELTKRGMPLGTDTGKNLSLSVTDAQIFWGFATIRCITHIEIENGRGYSARFEGNAASGWTLYKACRVAVTRALALALNDPKILDYLTTEADLWEE